MRRQIYDCVVVTVKDAKHFDPPLRVPHQTIVHLRFAERLLDVRNAGVICGTRARR